MSDTNIDKIIERIRKLLAMAADVSSPNEAAIAARRARRLMDEHQVSLTDLKEKSSFGFEYADKPYRFMPKWKSMLSVAIARVNDCKAALHTEWKAHNRSYSQRILIQGFECDVRVARHMYDYLVTTIDRLCAEDQAKHRISKSYNAQQGNAFKYGAASEIVKRLQELQEERKGELKLAHQPGMSLVVYKMAQVEQHFGKFTTHRTSVWLSNADHVESARQRGIEAGRSINLSTQVSDSNSRGLLK